MLNANRCARNVGDDLCTRQYVFQAKGLAVPYRRKAYRRTIGLRKFNISSEERGIPCTKEDACTSLHGRRSQGLTSQVRIASLAEAKPEAPYPFQFFQRGGNPWTESAQS
jgi:hypothetical protein